MGLFNKTSKTGMTQPYMKNGFWYNPLNHFWKVDTYTDNGKAICENFVKELKESDRALTKSEIKK